MLLWSNVAPHGLIQRVWRNSVIQQCDSAVRFSSTIQQSLENLIEKIRLAIIPEIQKNYHENTK